MAIPAYMNRALDGTSHRFYTWLTSPDPDYLLAEYPGPGTPSDHTILGAKIYALDSGGGGGLTRDQAWQMYMSMWDSSL